MMYTSVSITVTMGKNRREQSFEYALDNEICPKIVIPATWKEKCQDGNSVLTFIDNVFKDSDDCLEEGLKATIAEFDECYPPDFQSGKEYAKFQKAIQKGLHTIEDLRRISFKVFDTEEGTTIDAKELIFSE